MENTHGMVPSSFIKEAFYTQDIFSLLDHNVSFVRWTQIVVTFFNARQW